ncbi:HNH endonuclease [Phaeobacter sp. Ay1a-4a]|uniref:HNH endonuclease n=1 Tax=Phaeobacter sp. Ay1a-4a TaxID=3112439 RepID=UPI003A89F1E2
MNRRRMNTTRRARIFAAANGVCHICGDQIDGTRERWDADHVIPLEISGDDSDDNLRPAHEWCHRTKTAKEDAPTIAKCKRVAAKHDGSKKPKGTLPGSKNSKWKRKVDGTVVPR